MAYKYFNPNPSNLSVGDCTIRAISKLISKDWVIAGLQKKIWWNVLKI